MLLTVDHLTIYNYGQPVRGVVQSHRLVPASFTGQKVLDWKVSVSEGVQGGAFRDGAGDWIAAWSVQGPVEEIRVHVTGRVETADQAGVLRGMKSLVCPEVYLRDTRATAAEERLRELAEAGRSADVLAGVHELMAAVADAVAYVPGATEAHTTAAEALAKGEGVCQDHAQVMIACARVLGLPARYVSGYLYARPDEEEAAAQEAAHAWAEIHVAGLGWVGFDAANRCCPDERYIRLGSGFDAQDAAPIRGIARGEGDEHMEVRLSVGLAPAAQVQQQ